MRTLLKGGSVVSGTGVKRADLLIENEKVVESGRDLKTEADRVVDVTEHLVPDYHYEKMLEENPDSLLGRYIRTMQEKPRNVVTEKALEFGVNALLGHQICR